MESIFQEEGIGTLMAIGILIMLALALAFVLFVSYSQKKILKEKVRVQQLSFQHQEELLHATILTQEVERKRIARDLHDEIGSKLNVVFLNVCRLKPYGKEHEEIDSIANEVESVLNTTIDSIRFISHELLPPTLEEFGLVEAIRELQHSFNALEGIDIDFVCTEQGTPIGSSLVELNLFRVLQELINNSLKHAKASEIGIALTIDDNDIKMQYKDNGFGFDSSKIETKKGLGMKNIESRLHIIRATHQYNSSLGKGTEVMINLVRNASIKV